MKDGTKAVHLGQAHDKASGAVIPPICQSSTFAHTSPGVPISEYEYTRAGNPNFTALEAALAGLENGKYATVFSSGLGAISAWLAELGPSKIAANRDLYGGTYRLLTGVFEKFDLHCEFVDAGDPSAWRNAAKKGAKWFFIETPTNPLLNIIDVRSVVKLARSLGVRVIVDNTFATPCLQKPLDMGADVVIHSTTKYIGGHSDVVGGALITNDDILKNRYDYMRKAIGLNPSPFDCWLTSRGLKTIELRVSRQCESALAIAKALDGAKTISRVLYPGLASHPQHMLAKSQMKAFGGIVSVDLKKPTHAVKFIQNLKLFALAESLGGVESLVCQPSSMTHASVPKEKREEAGVFDTLVRLSVGVEDTVDLIDDVKSALRKL